MIGNLKATSDQMPATMKHVDALVTELTGTSAEIRERGGGSSTRRFRRWARRSVT